MAVAERWVAIPGYGDSYEVSDLGRVRSIARERNVGHGTRMVRGRVLRRKPGIYPSVTLASYGDNKTHHVHILVLSAFVGLKPHPKMEACHWDGKKWNCKLSNLRWDFRSGNHADRVRHGVSNRGERCGTSKLTRIQVSTIRVLRAGGEKQNVLARRFGVTPSLISMIVNNKRWSYGSN